MRPCRQCGSVLATQLDKVTRRLQSSILSCSQLHMLCRCSCRQDQCCHSSPQRCATNLPPANRPPSVSKTCAVSAFFMFCHQHVSSSQAQRGCHSASRQAGMPNMNAGCRRHLQHAYLKLLRLQEQGRCSLHRQRSMSRSLLLAQACSWLPRLTLLRLTSRCYRRKSLQQVNMHYADPQAQSAVFAAQAALPPVYQGRHIISATFQLQHAARCPSPPCNLSCAR